MIETQTDIAGHDRNAIIGSSMAGFTEKRSFVRYPIPTLIDLELEDGSYHHEYTKNISETGLFIEASKMLSIGTMATLRFAVPNLDWVFEINAKVIWMVQVTHEEKLDGKKDGMGFLFIDMSPEDRDHMITYIKNFKIEDLEL